MCNQIVYGYLINTINENGDRNVYRIISKIWKSKIRDKRRF